MNSHIDDIVGLIDRVLGPDTDGPVPTASTMVGRREPGSPPLPLRDRTGPERRPTRGPYGVHQLRGLSLIDLSRHLGGRDSCPLAHNTKLVRTASGGFGVVLHRTQIMTVEFDVGGTLDYYARITLDTGGWQTVTTKQRLNALLPAGYRISQLKREWWLSTPDSAVAYSDGLAFEVQL
jgi:hypothetical protein